MCGGESGGDGGGVAEGGGREGVEGECGEHCWGGGEGERLVFLFLYLRFHGGSRGGEGKKGTEKES